MEKKPTVGGRVSKRKRLERETVVNFRYLKTKYRVSRRRFQDALYRCYLENVHHERKRVRTEHRKNCVKEPAGFYRIVWEPQMSLFSSRKKKQKYSISSRASKTIVKITFNTDIYRALPFTVRNPLKSSHDRPHWQSQYYTIR